MIYETEMLLAYIAENPKIVIFSACDVIGNWGLQFLVGFILFKLLQ